MDYQMTCPEALEVAKSCHTDVYPPTNIYILCNAIQTLYKYKGICEEISWITTWLDTLVKTDNLKTDIYERRNV